MLQSTNRLEVLDAQLREEAPRRCGPSRTTRGPRLQIARWKQRARVELADRNGPSSSRGAPRPGPPSRARFKAVAMRSTPSSVSVPGSAGSTNSAASTSNTELAGPCPAPPLKIQMQLAIAVDPWSWCGSAIRASMRPDSSMAARISPSE